MNKSKVLLAGATGYLGRHIATQLKNSKFDARLIVRNQAKAGFDSSDYEVIEAQVTQTETLENICQDVDYVISTVGITRQKDGLTYMDVDYQANVNLIDEAKKRGVKKFIYVSALNGQHLRHLKIFEAKEKLVDYLKNSGLDYCIIRPNGFFSDMGDFLDMAKSGKVYLFGDGNLRLNPIHGEDLAKACLQAIDNQEKEVNIGGQDILSHRQIAELAFQAHQKPVKIIFLPDWIRKFVLWSVRTFTSPKTYGVIEFFLTTMNMEMIAPKYGQNRLEDFFKMKVQA